ncbi:hypothetical protein A9995_15380 [Erythrobacter sp. QSSC1-22B]|nr:hypothetical protein A9995_15380 [Erythrobacter sp. QSSC1-22B]
MLTGGALDSVLKQDYLNFEVLVVDDASTDDTSAVIAVRDDARVRYLKQQTNQGVAAARNRGIAEAKGALIAFLDSDDQWVPEKLSRQVELARRRPDLVGLFYTGAVERWQDGDSVWLPTVRGRALSHLLHRNVLHVTTSSTLIRREVFEVVGFFDERTPANEDHDMWTRIATFFEIDYVDEPLIIYSHAALGMGGEDRRSQNFAANMQARLDFLTFHGAEAKRFKVRHLFHLDCARRHLESPHGQIKQARMHLAKAVIDCPRQPRLGLWLSFSLLPGFIRKHLTSPLQRLKTHLPSRLWMGRSSPSSSINQTW